MCYVGPDTRAASAYYRLEWKLVDQRQRQKRLRALVSKLNKERKKQAKKVDILCNDLIAAQRGFLRNLDTIGFAANFYEAIVGTTDLNSLLQTAARLIQNEIGNPNITFFLRQDGSFESYLFEGDHANVLQELQIKKCFNFELMDSICKSNSLCDLNSLVRMGLQVSPTAPDKVSAFTVPLSAGASIGFILLCRSPQNRLTGEELEHVSAITGGLSRAIQSCKVLAHSGG